MLDNFTEEARRAVVLAADEARVLGHDHIGTEHLLLGLVRLNDPVTERLDLTLPGTRASVRDLVGGGGGGRTIGELLFTRPAKEALDRADALAGPEGSGPAQLLEALRAQAGSGAAQLINGADDGSDALLAVFADPDSVGARALRRLGVDERRLRRALDDVRAEG